MMIHRIYPCSFDAGVYHTGQLSFFGRGPLLKFAYGHVYCPQNAAYVGDAVIIWVSMFKPPFFIEDHHLRIVCSGLLLTQYQLSYSSTERSPYYADTMKQINVDVYKCSLL